jgi:Skp family chaperone for outer membrane proteins
MALDNKRKNQSITEPTPFTFHQPKSTANMRQYLDIENQKINPTMRPRARSATKTGRSMSLGNTMLEKEAPKEAPSTTAKFEAYKNHRRKEMEDKKQNEESKFQEEVQRFVK